MRDIKICCTLATHIVKEKEKKNMLRPEYCLGAEKLDTHQNKKRERILAVAQILATRKLVHTAKFIVELEFNGLRRKVAKEYIDALIDLDWLTTDGNHLLWVGPN